MYKSNDICLGSVCLKDNLAQRQMKELKRIIETYFLYALRLPKSYNFILNFNDFFLI
jgi:hypothetical protein